MCARTCVNTCVMRFCAFIVEVCVHVRLCKCGRASVYVHAFVCVGACLHVHLLARRRNYSDLVSKRVFA